MNLPKQKNKRNTAKIPTPTGEKLVSIKVVKATKTVVKTKVATVDGKGIKTPFPADIKPMLATLVSQPFDEEGWLYEVKWDGYRAIAYLNKDEVDIRSRNNKSFNEKFYPIHTALQQLKINAVIDGEILVVNDKGTANFSGLQQWRSEADGELIFYIFDILWINGHSLIHLPLTARKQILHEQIKTTNNIRISENFDAGGKEFFAIAQKMNLEGIIAKKADSIYTPGLRSNDWLKIKTHKRQEVVIGGYTNNEGSKKPFSALLVGVYENNILQYTGKIGTGFTNALQTDILKQFKPLVVNKCPFAFEPDINKPSRFRPNPPKATATWLKPQLVCEVSFAEMTSDGVMRHPSFEGMREDKNPTEIVREMEKETEQVVAEDNHLTNKKIIVPPGAKNRKTLLNPTDETQVRSVNGHDLKFTNLSKIFWPQDGIAKRDLLNYYYQVAPYILPYMKDRPQSLNRHPQGINGMSFYQKNVTGKVPDWIKTFPYFSEKEQEEKNFLVCTNEASLLYISSLGCIEMNPWSSRVQAPDNPDWCIIDLDPDKNTFDQVIEAANVTKQILDNAGVPAYCKTSGSTGLHIYIPLGAKYIYEESKEFARVIAKLVHAELPKFTSIERATKDRGGKMYIDFLQNRPQATIATAYSVRPKPGATVSTPLHWEEVKKGLAIQQFTIKNVMDRLKAEGDLFKPVIGKGINMEKALKKLQSLG